MITYFKVVYNNKYLLVGYLCLLLLTFYIMYIPSIELNIIHVVLSVLTGANLGGTSLGIHSYSTYKRMLKILRQNKKLFISPKSYCDKVGYRMAIQQFCKDLRKIEYYNA